MSGVSYPGPGVYTTDGTVIKLPAASNAFGQQPTGTTPNTAISPPITVRLIDRCGNPATDSTATVSLALGTNPGGATLGGTTSVAAVAGIATFDDLTISEPGAGYTLTASSSGLSDGTSNAFNVTCQAITVTSTVSSGTVGASYSETFTQSGGIGATTFSTTGGVLPAGLTLSSNGLLTGTPSAAGTFSFTISATDANGCSGSTEYTVTMMCEAITVNFSGVPNEVCPGVSSTLTVNLSGGTAPWSVLLSDGNVQTGSTSTFNFSVNPLTTGLTRQRDRHFWLQRQR